VFAALSEKLLEEQLNGAAEVLEEGYIVGAYGLLLRKCAQASIPAITLLTQSHYNYPDPEAAAAALTAVNKILGLKVDISDLLKRGEEIRLRSKDMMHRTHEEMNRMDKSHEYDLPPLYG
jgi:predicted ATP-grasp superfamily ATP-dependent carboligase